MKLIKNKYLVISVRRIKLKKMLDLKIWRTELLAACRDAAVPSMNALNRRVRFILIKFWSTVAVQQLSFSIDVIIWISIFWPTKEKMQKQHVSSLKSGKKNMVATQKTLWQWSADDLWKPAKKNVWINSKWPSTTRVDERRVESRNVWQLQINVARRN